MPHVSPGPAAAGMQESSEDAGEQQGCSSDTHTLAKPPTRSALQASQASPEPIEQPIYKSFACPLALGLLKALTLL